MVASQSVAQESQHDMYNSNCQPPYGEYYAESHFYPVPGSGGAGPHPADLCPAHTTITVQSDYGPVTVPMVSTNTSPPIAMPVQVPPGHVVQQIVDENGTLRHLILSPQHPTNMGGIPIGAHNHQHYGGGPGNGGNQPPQSFYTPGLPPSFQPPHFHSNIPPGAHGPPSSQHPSHSPPPGHGGGNNTGYYKDERTQRQYNKLKKKLHDKQHHATKDATMTSMTTATTTTTTQTTNNNNNNNGHSNHHLLSPRKELINGLHRNANKDKGMNSVGTSEDGEESSSVQDEEDCVNYITDVLSSVQSPKVSDLNSRSALIQWAVPPRLTETSSTDGHDLEISEADLRYEVLLSDKSKEMKYKSIYSGASLSCRIQDLRPGQEYSVCLQVHFDELQGSASDPVKFTTPPCVPDQPQPPKLLCKSRNSLQVKWNAVNDNGSHILYYILEYDDGKGGDFIELYKSKGKQHTLSKLQPATVYKFRLAAANEIGKSAYSDVVTYETADTPPIQPLPPCLKEARINSLHLFWQRRPKDKEFTLQMDDPKTGHGYKSAYTGSDNECYIGDNLQRFTDYKFRLKSENEGGSSPWSEEVTFRTLPDRPARPSKPVLKGRVHAYSFRLKWEPPTDTGGAEITRYDLELNSGSGYQTIYTGSETEANCDKLTPGTTYQLRVSCISSGGRSNYSDPCTVTTEAIGPVKCTMLKVQGKPKTNTVTIKWIEPDYNGGAPVLEYEIEMTNPDKSNTMLKSKTAECVVNGLNPGCNYTFVVRAVNRIGPGPWSDPLTVTSAPAAPEAPSVPTVVPKSPFQVYVEWSEPHNNGALIMEYRLELSHNDSKEHFHPVFQGLSTNYDVKGLTPCTPYYFRVQACNLAGYGEFSTVAATITPAAPPSVVVPFCSEKTPTTIVVKWQEAACNGSPITHYNLEIGDRIVSTEGNVSSYVLESLHPDTPYKIRVQAVNVVGSGPFSSTLKVSTAPLPPAPPKLECVGTGHNYLKLKWGEGKNHNFTQFCVEMENTRSKEFQCVYQGTSFVCKVNKLQELTTYRFRISASNDAGQGDFSEEYLFTTSIAPPAAVKGLRVIEVEQKSCLLEWNPIKNITTDSVIYSVQVTRLKDQDYKQVYKGPDTKFTIDNLESGAEYCARVGSIRVTSTGELQGPYSSSVTFTTSPSEQTLIPKLSVNNSAPVHSHRPRSYAKLTWPPLINVRTMSEQQMVLLVSVSVLFFGIVMAWIIMWLLRLK